MPFYAPIGYNSIMANQRTIRKIQLKQLDTRLSELNRLQQQIPRIGWIKAIREALGMSARQLAARLGISQAAVAKIETGEVRKTTSLQTLERVAEALECKLVYALVPRDTLEKMVQRQAKLVAEKIVKRVSHTMELEKQGISPRREKEQIEELAQEMAQELARNLWEPIK
jgi:predicted DNA-binding mobile mystery protein A